MRHPADDLLGVAEDAFARAMSAYTVCLGENDELVRELFVADMCAALRAALDAGDTGASGQEGRA